MTVLTIFSLLAILGIVAVTAWSSLLGRIRKVQDDVDNLRAELAAIRKDDGPQEADSEPRVPDFRPENSLIDSPVPTPAIEAPAPSNQPTRSSQLRVDWERWLGVRGAALLGGAALALAALLFLRFAIERGLIPPPVRVVACVVAGLAAIWMAESLRRRAYTITANSLAGAGIVTLYGAFWAANQLYDLIATLPAFGLMIMVTIACAMLARRHRSQVIAILGLAGGFATPLLLQTRLDDPISLFGYILLLDTGLLMLARQLRWPMLGILGLAASTFIQSLWIFLEMGPEQIHLGLLIVTVFPALFLAMANRPDAKPGSTEATTWRLTQIASVLLPFLFAFHFASTAELGSHLWEVAILLILLSFAAEWCSRVHNAPLIGISATGADIAVVLAWIRHTSLDNALAWEVVAIVLGLALAFHVFVELDLWKNLGRQQTAVRSTTALVATSGFFLLLVGVSLGRVPSMWPWLVGWVGLASLLIRQANLPGLAYRQLIASGLMGLGFAFYFDAHRGTPALPGTVLYFSVIVAASMILQLLVYTQKDSAARKSALVAAALLPAVVLMSLLGDANKPVFPASYYLWVTLILALFLVVSGTRLREGRILGAAMAVLSFEHLLWTANQVEPGMVPRLALLAFGVQLAAMLLFVAWPFAIGSRSTGDRWIWYAAALAPPAWFLSLKMIFESRFGDSAIGLLPLGLGALSLGAAIYSHRILPTHDPQRRRNLVWFTAVALGLLSIAIPLQLEREWITIGWALQGLALVGLWKYLDHPGLKYLGLALLGAATLRLIANPALLDYHPREVWPVFNWLMYTYLVPAVALLGSSAILRPFELDRLLPWERPAYARGYPLAAIGCAIAAILVVFVWINLTVFDAFSPGLSLAISLDRLPARDLTLSLSWAVYALALLAVGMARRSQGLRWVSLAFFVLTIGKVFLYDLGELEDLYRVASLVGLASSLILVSLAYQRFVFGKHLEAMPE